MSLTPTELQKLEKYLQQKFANNKITLKSRPKADDSVEFLLDGEYMGTIYKDEEDGDISYCINLSILSIDLDEAA
jgi:hypothetical protein